MNVRGRTPFLLLVICVSFVCSILVLGDTLWGKRVLSSMDYLPYLYPFFRFSRRIWLATGALPLWLPHLHGGMPLLASMNSMLLYPTELLAVISGVNAGMFYAWDGLFHLMLSAVGGYVLLCALGFSRLASLSGGLIYAFSGLTVTILGIGDPRELRVAAILPFLVYFVRRSAVGEFRSGIVASLIVCVLFLATAAQMTAYSLVWIAVLLFMERPLKSARPLMCLLAIFVCGALLGAVWLAPALEYLPHSARAVHDSEFASDQALLPVYLLELVFPGVLGRTSAESVFIATRYVDNITLYAGYLPLGMALVGTSLSWRKYFPWLVAGIAAFLLSFGPGMPWGSAVQSIPGFSGFRIWRRWLYLGNISFMVFFAVGLDAFLASRIIRRRITMMMGGLFAVCCMAWLGKGLFIRQFRDLSPVKEAISSRNDVGPRIDSIVKGALHRSVCVSAMYFAVTAGLSGVMPGALLGATVVTGLSLADLTLNGKKYACATGTKELNESDEVRRWFYSRRGDYRILSAENPNTIRDICINRLMFRQKKDLLDA